jgi:F0F1-type ATP synthase alpha subunit
LDKSENYNENETKNNADSFYNINIVENAISDFGKGATSDVETKAPHIMDRSMIDRAVITGLKVVDCLFPIGKGQRQLILGDKQSGKTTIGYLVMVTQAKLNSYYII